MPDNEPVANLSCGNLDCRVAETGRCVEGFELNSCPHYGLASEEEDGEIPPEDDLADTGQRNIHLSHADTLTVSEASELLRAGEGRVIAILGPSDSGKTSLIASLYDLFQGGPIGDIEFTQSRTLHAFEHTCHDARSASRRTEPHMNRTPRGEVRFYHIDIQHEANKKALTLILGDRAGEEYREAVDDITIVGSFSEVLRADSLTILVDGERLLDAGARHNLRSDIIMMLQALSDGNGLREGTRIALVLTKFDCVKNSPHEERALRDFSNLIDEIQRLFGTKLSNLDSFKIAASPKKEGIQRGTGIPELLIFWLCPHPTPTNSIASKAIFERAFSQLIPLDESVE